MQHNVIRFACAALAAAGLMVAGGARPAAAQTIVNQIAGTKQTDGTFLWQYQVTSGTSPALSHFVLVTCEDVFHSIVHGSIMGTNPGTVEYVLNDSTTGATGIKFDEGFADGQTRIISFRLTQDYLPTTTSVFTKSAHDVKELSVTGPGCTVRGSSAVPESGTAALALTALLPTAGLVSCRRRRCRKASSPLAS